MTREYTNTIIGGLGSMEVYKGHKRLYPYCEITGQRYLNGCTCNSCKAFFKRGAERSAKRRKAHPMKGCHCPDCVKRREYNRIAMNKLYRQHPMKFCQCDWCKKRRAYLDTANKNKRESLMLRRRDFKEKVVKELGGRCAMCGFIPDHPCQIDLHERNGFARRRGAGTPAHLITTMWGKRAVWENLDEFIPLCKNCHGKLSCKFCSGSALKKIADWRRPT